jgi:hypothetical protein
MRQVCVATLLTVLVGSFPLALARENFANGVFVFTLFVGCCHHLTTQLLESNELYSFPSSMTLVPIPLITHALYCT